MSKKIGVLIAVLAGVALAAYQMSVKYKPAPAPPAMALPIENPEAAATRGLATFNFSEAARNERLGAGATQRQFSAFSNAPRNERSGAGAAQRQLAAWYYSETMMVGGRGEEVTIGPFEKADNCEHSRLHKVNEYKSEGQFLKIDLACKYYEQRPAGRIAFSP